MHLETWSGGSWHLGIAWVDGAFELHFGKRVLRFGIAI